VRQLTPGAGVVADDQVGNHVGAGIAGDHAAGVGTERDAGEVHTGIYQGQDGRTEILRDGAAAQERFGIAVHADGSAADVGGAAVVVKIVGAIQVALAVSV